ncbi:hypothetical protein AA14337_0311 [Acetobacter malorum DSM 14337]|uniref:Phage protein n=1 Tax=Acetobacter malorum DSM 14337 TaxID=1307910 RepID=A0ABQ0PM77_9PROT|nr:hypothetical protein [Acetobacter malorum]KXV07041.1 hypothetical protein AD930_05700 [Acetobacter malorum]GBQ75752.1 hypothetical protein AA14337_0311 [Acetobacter malorum DSM 14337]
MKTSPVRKNLAETIAKIKETEVSLTKVDTAYWNATSTRGRQEKALEEAKEKVQEAHTRKASLMADRLLGQKVTDADPVDAAEEMEREAQLSLRETEAVINELKRRKGQLEEERERLSFKRSNLIKEVVSESAVAIHLHRQVTDAAKTLLDATKSLRLLRDRGCRVPYPEEHKPAGDTLERMDTFPSSWVENRIPGALQLAAQWGNALSALEEDALYPLPGEGKA